MKKVKKNKMMFNELLNAMDMVGFLDEVTSNFVWFFSSAVRPVWNTLFSRNYSINSSTTRVRTELILLTVSILLKAKRSREENKISTFKLSMPLVLEVLEIIWIFFFLKLHLIYADRLRYS